MPDAVPPEIANANLPELEVVPAAAIQHVSIKPPAFMECAVLGWFAIMEAQFHLARIQSQETKFYHVLASLPATTIAKLNTSVLTTPNFLFLKEAVVELYEKSKPELFDQLISKVQLTGKPSLYVRELQDLASKVGVGDDLVRHKLLQSLPPTVGAVLAAQRELTLHQLGKLADELMPLLQTSCLAAPAETRLQQQDYSSARGSSYPTRGNSPAHPQESRGPSLPRGLQPFHQDQRPQVCRAHLYFGGEARTCKPWCRWPKKSHLQMQPSSRRSSPDRQGN